MKSAAVLGLLFACAFASGAESQVECRWADTPITIDGVGNDAAWAHAHVIDFYVPWLKEQAQSPKTKASARLVWDRDYLYFYADIEDKNLTARITEHDGQVWSDDVFELFFKPARDKPGYYEFQVNPLNTKLDMFLWSREECGGYWKVKGSHPFDFMTAVKVHGTINDNKDRDTGWSCEGRIPWRDFLMTGGRPVPGEMWYFALCRYDYANEKDFELSTSAPLTQPSFHRHEDYAPLRFVGPDEKTSRPYGIAKRLSWDGSRLTGTPDPPPPYRLTRVYPNLKVDYPINLFAEPGTQNMLLLSMTGSWGGQGKLWRFRDTADVNSAELLLHPDYIMYGLAFHPDYEKNGYLFIGSNGPQSGKIKKTRVTRYTIARTPPFALDPKSETVIIEWESDGHNGGDLVFGNDGLLYVTSGDGTSDSDKNIAGQDLSKLLSKVLRIDVSRPAAGQPYAVPADNPFVGLADIRPETWAYGLRNPWRIAIDRASGALWVGNNGQDLWEQVYLIKKGENYGWSVMEGSYPFYPDRKAGPHPITKPVAEHPHSEARSLTGGQVYAGSKLPELRGTYLYGDFSTGKIWGVRQDGDKVTPPQEIANSVLRITGFGWDTSGELLVTDYGGGFYKLERAPEQTGAPPFPRKLSETGLFASVKGHRPHPALIPYTVNAPLWSDGAHKQRYLALPGADSTINYTTGRSWDFPDGTVLVKSFALDTEAGKPKSRRWVETRLLIKQQGQWAGYTYQWNEQQNEAYLVGKEGHDENFSIKDKTVKGGKRDQPWHYPSRAECMVCHSRAANFVLGLNELQLNTSYDFDRCRDNQLRALEHLGVLRLNYAEHERKAIIRDAKAQGKTEQEAQQIAARYNIQPNQRGAQTTALLARHPERLARLTDPYDAQADLNMRARSYLHANCAQCHIEAGGGNAAMELEFTRAQNDMRLLGAKPLHNTFDLPDARLVAPGKPESSVLLHRISRRGVNSGQMPPLATHNVDAAAVELFREWIKSLPPESGR